MTNRRDDRGKIQEDMARIRHALHEDVEQVVVQAKELTDWRNFVRRHPLLTAGLAASVGYLLVPRRSNAVPSRMGEAVMAPQFSTGTKRLPGKKRWTASIVTPMVRLAGTVLMRKALAVATQSISSALVSGTSQEEGTERERAEALECGHD